MTVSVVYTPEAASCSLNTVSERLASWLTKPPFQVLDPPTPLPTSQGDTGAQYYGSVGLCPTQDPIPSQEKPALSEQLSNLISAPHSHTHQLPHASLHLIPLEASAEPAFLPVGCGCRPAAWSCWGVAGGAVADGFLGLGHPCSPFLSDVATENERLPIEKKE